MTLRQHKTLSSGNLESHQSCTDGKNKSFNFNKFIVNSFSLADTRNPSVNIEINQHYPLLLEFSINFCYPCQTFP